MPDAPVRPVDGLGVDAVELAHAAGEVGLRRLDHEVIMVGHLAPGGTAPAEPPADLAEDVEEAAAVVIVEVDVAPRVAARRHVIERAGKLDAQRARHVAVMSCPVRQCKT